MLLFCFFRTKEFKEFGNPENLTNSDLPQTISSSGSSPASVSPVSSKHLNTGALPITLDQDRFPLQSVNDVEGLKHGNQSTSSFTKSTTDERITNQRQLEESSDDDEVKMF